MPGVFVGATELTTVGDIKIGGTDVQEIYVGATKVFPSGAPLTAIFDWNIETGEIAPVTSTFARAGVRQARTTTDGSTFWYQQAKSGELPIDDMRRVENLSLGDIFDWSAPGWTVDSGVTVTPNSGPDPFSGNNASEIEFTDVFQRDRQNTKDVDRPGPGKPFICSFYIKTISGPFSDFRFFHEGNAGAGGNSTRIEGLITSSWQRIQFRGVMPVADLNLGLQNFASETNVVQVYGFSLEAVQDETDDVAGEILEHDVIYNADAVAVQYQTTTNANTVSANPGVITAIAGSTITSGNFQGEPAETQLLATDAIRDFSDAAWSATNITPAQDAKGIDGAVLASTLTATANNGTIFAAFTRSSAAHTFNVFVARKTGTGTIEITIDGGSTFTDITSSLTADIVNRFEVTQTLANPSIGFRIGTSGDEIEADYANLVESEFGSSPINISGTRVADSLTDVTWPASSSAVIDITVPVSIPGGDDATRVNMLGFGTGTDRNFQIFASNQAAIINGGISSTITAGSSYEGERHSFGMSLVINEGIVVDDEDNDNTDVTGTPGGGTIQIGLSSGLVGVPGKMHRIRIYDQTQSVAELKALL